MQRARALVWPIGLRLLACLVQAVFLHNSLLRYAEEPRRITLLFLITSEIATFLGLLLSRWAKQTDYPPLALAMVASAYSYTILLDATAGISLIPEPVGAVVQIVAICWTIFAKASLGRSFGLLPANRGVVVRGAYRWVRHPIYAGYLFIHLGFLAVNFGLRNLVVLSLLYFIQIGRLLREESSVVRQHGIPQLHRGCPLSLVARGVLITRRGAIVPSSACGA